MSRFMARERRDTAEPPDTARARRVPCGAGFADEQGSCLDLKPSSSPPIRKMGTKRKNPTDPIGNTFSVAVGLYNNFSKFDELQDDQKVVILDAHLKLMQNFINSWKEKDNPGKSNDILSGDKLLLSKRNTFKEKVMTYFGEYLSSNVVDALSNLVEDNSYNKCHYCSLPTESLVLSVLQVLVDANELQKSKILSKAAASNMNNDTHYEKPTSINGDIGRHTEYDQVHHKSGDKIQNLSSASKGLSGKTNENTIPILDTPVFMIGNELNRNASLSPQQASEPSFDAPNAKFIEVDPSNEPYTKYMKPADPSLKVSPEVHIIKESKQNGIVLDLVKIAEHIYNKKNVINLATENMTRADLGHSHQHQSKSTDRFAVSETELRYYKILCGLANRQWSCHEGVMLYKTSVTYNSLGESIEPFGHVDNFFIVGYCCKLFDDSHPRL